VSKLPENNLIRHPSLVDHRQREAANGHKAAVVWFTGLPGSGKPTTAHAVERQLFDAGCQAFVLDGDNVRHGLSADLGFSPAHREGHMRRVGELAKLMFEAGMIVLCAIISPMRAGRAKVRKLIPAHSFFEVHCQCPVEVCENRDPKGFYARVKAGGITEYTGVSAPYEEPSQAELVLDTAGNTAGACAQHVVQVLAERGLLYAKSLT
jgi:adenylylsulfate kinase